MRVVGRLINASTLGRDDVFEGYAVEIRYLQVAQHSDPPTYVEANAHVVCRGTDPSFAFDLPDQHELAIEDRLTIAVHNRDGEQVFSNAWPMLTILGEGERLELRIDKVSARAAGAAAHHQGSSGVEEPAP